MNTIKQTTTLENSARKLAVAAGVFYLITHVTSIGAAIMYDPILHNENYVTGFGPDILALTGVVFEIILALAIVGTSVALFPIAKRQNEGIALGYVGLRTLEAGIIAVGVIPLLSLISLRQHMAGTVDTDTTTLMTISSTLVEFYNWAALVGPGLVCGVNTVLMAYLMYRSHLVPRFIPVLGLVGGPLIFAVNTMKMFGILDFLPAWIGIAVIPIFAWEITLAIWLITKGFRSEGSAALMKRTAINEIQSEPFPFGLS